MDYLSIIKQLDSQPNQARLKIIIEWLNGEAVPFRLHQYSTGINLIVEIGSGPWIGVGSHYDRVETTAGANDNSSSIVVCLELISRITQAGTNGIGVRFFFFDEEETGLKGSRAYVRDFGVSDMIGLVNMEMVGRGDMLAIWPVQMSTQTKLLNVFEKTADQQGIKVYRFDRIVTNTADHLPFIQSGLIDSFSITCVSKADLIVAQQYFEALAQDKSPSELFKVLSTAPLFEHYHQPTDTYEKLDIKSLTMTAGIIEKTIHSIKENA